MTGKRMWQTIRLYLTPGVGRRTEYYRKKHIFASMGENCSIMDRKVPLYSNLIKLGNNVHIDSGVVFITHDISNSLFNNLVMVKNLGYRFKEQIGCIEIGDNVLIGADTKIFSNVKIGSNVIVGACSLIDKDIPDNSVVEGAPARVVGDFDEYIINRLKDESYIMGIWSEKEKVHPELEEYCWKQFYKSRES